MRVLLVTPEFPPETLGGLGRYSIEVAAALAELIDLTVLHAPTYRLPSGGAGAGRGDPRVVVLPTSGMVDAIASKSTRPCLSAALTQAEAAVADFVQSGIARFDIAYVQDYAASPIVAALWRAGLVRRVVAACHLPLYAGFTYFDRALADDAHQMLEALLLRLAHLVITPSAFTRSVILRTYNVAPWHVHVVPLATGRPFPVSPRAADGRRAVVGTVARFTEQKGLHYIPALLAALEALDLKVSIKLLASGRGRDRFESLLREAEVLERVDILEARPGDEVWAFYDSIDVFFSMSLYETFGLAPLEAMASGCPPVAFDVGALPDVYGSLGPDLLVPVGDVAAMAKRIASILPESRRAPLQMRCLEQAATFSWKVHVQTLLALWSTLL